MTSFRLQAMNSTVIALKEWRARKQMEELAANKPKKPSFFIEFAIQNAKELDEKAIKLLKVLMRSYQMQILTSNRFTLQEVGKYAIHVEPHDNVNFDMENFCQSETGVWQFHFHDCVFQAAVSLFPNYTE